MAQPPDRRRPDLHLVRPNELREQRREAVAEAYETAGRIFDETPRGYNATFDLGTRDEGKTKVQLRIQRQAERTPADDRVTLSVYGVRDGRSQSHGSLTLETTKSDAYLPPDAPTRVMYKPGDENHRHAWVELQKMSEQAENDTLELNNGNKKPNPQAHLDWAMRLLPRAELLVQQRAAEAAALARTQMDIANAVQSGKLSAEKLERLQQMIDSLANEK